MKKLPLLPSILVLILLMTANPLFAQQKAIMGEPAPGFSLQVTSGKTLKTQTSTLSSYQGRWLILEFWSKTCANCIAGFPKLDTLAQKYSAVADILLIGKNDGKYNAGIEKFYQKISRQQGLKLDHAFADALLDSYSVQGYPYVVIIDPNGRIASITYPQELTPENLYALFSGKGNLMLQQGKFATSTTSPDSFAKLIDSAGASAHQSTLESWKSGDEIAIRMDLEKNTKNGRFLTSGTQLFRLFKIAYFGKGSWNYADPLYAKAAIQVALEIRDSSQFSFDPFKPIGHYRYQLQMNELDPSLELLQKAIQDDLSKWFPYQVKIERREVNGYELIVPAAKSMELKSKSADQQIKGDPSGYSFRAVRPAEVLRVINSYHPNLQLWEHTPAGLLIDVSLDATMIDFKMIKEALQREGLMLKPATKCMDVLVITDKN